MTELTIDIKLILIFISMLETGSQSDVADTFGVSQPAIHKALKKLKVVYNDELFTYNHKLTIFTPTQKALALAPKFIEIRDIFNSTLGKGKGHEAFDYVSASNHFSIAMNGYAFSTKFNRFMDYIYNTSPGIKILAKFLEQDRTERALIGNAAKLDSGEFDLILDQYNVHYQNFDSEKLKTDEWVVVSAQSNSFNDEISEADFLNAKHIVCTMGGDNCYRGTKNPKLDVALEVPSYTNVIETVAQTQYIATIPKEVALSYVKRLKINVYECPFETNSLELFMYSSKEPINAVAQQWLKQTVIYTFNS